MVDITGPFLARNYNSLAERNTDVHNINPEKYFRTPWKVDRKLMDRFEITWSVDEIVNGRDFDNDRRQGDRSTIADGHVFKEGEEQNLREQLTEMLEQGFPRHQVYGTFEVDRVYNIKIERV